MWLKKLQRRTKTTPTEDLVQSLNAEVDDALKPAWAEYKIVPVTDIRPQDVDTVFKVQRAERVWTKKETEIPPVSDTLTSIIKDHALATGYAMPNAALNSARIGPILLMTLAQMKWEERVSAEPTISYESLCFRFNEKISFPCLLSSRGFLVSGMANYTLWFGGREQEEAGLVVLVEPLGEVDFSKTLIYAAMMHHGRRIARHADTVIYGIATDGDLWGFIRLGDDARYISCYLEWDTDQAEIISMIRGIIERAATNRFKASSNTIDTHNSDFRAS
ncbi:uncharacterized protein BDW43DRAFT_316329 [Aspergillus alliaceus]|uniref:uncharacterized protein n=1 Tax=Petromyces alliaceus TaxID=209559 RepID=UPI0012A6ADC9|nr:uncharacterized protein BDW43DRAFT_316329 [Aspergillus alliaceus]KAB8228024.1 hypothetical protein BDW43DRAFT_316329 [Aspergillus alliaceus]